MANRIWNESGTEGVANGANKPLTDEKLVEEIAEKIEKMKIKKTKRVVSIINKYQDGCKWEGKK